MERPRLHRDRARDSELERARARRIAALFSTLRELLGIPDATREEVLDHLITHIEKKIRDVVAGMIQQQQRLEQKNQ